jgi:hypothetical protein
MTAPASAYPRSVEDLMPAARLVPTRDGEVVPSRRRLMSELRIGAEKANEIRDRLLAEAARTPQGQMEITRDVLGRAGVNGIVPSVDELTARYGLDQNGARLLADLAKVAAQRPAGQPGSDVDGPAGTPAGAVKPDPVAASAIEHGPNAGDTVPVPAVGAAPAGPTAGRTVEASSQVRVDVDADDTGRPAKARPVVVWPIWLLMLPAFVAVWAGWVELGKLTGFGRVNLLPGIVEWATIDSAITLPIGMEVYAAYALYVWLSGRVPPKARKFAMFSALTALVLGSGGQVAYHLLATPETDAPWPITTVVACLPVAVLGMGAALAHLLHAADGDRTTRDVA